MWGVKMVAPPKTARSRGARLSSLLENSFVRRSQSIFLTLFAARGDDITANSRTRDSRYSPAAASKLTLVSNKTGGSYATLDCVIRKRARYAWRHYCQIFTSQANPRVFLRADELELELSRHLGSFYKHVCISLTFFSLSSASDLFEHEPLIRRSAYRSHKIRRLALDSHCYL